MGGRERGMVGVGEERSQEDCLSLFASTFSFWLGNVRC